MHPTLPLLAGTDFPALTRSRLDTLQVNLGYKCNQSCLHCHVNAGPNRTEMMDAATVDLVLDGAASARGIAHARPHRRRARAESALPPPGARRARARRARHRPLQPDHPVASRGRRTWPTSWPARVSRWSRRCRAIRRPTSTASAATACSIAASPRCARSTRSATRSRGSGLVLNLVYNPQGAVAAAAAGRRCEADYKRELRRALRHPLQPACTR